MFEITDSMVADYQSAWDAANEMPGREPGDRRRAGLSAVAPAIVAEVMQGIIDAGALKREDVEQIAFAVWRIDL